MYKLLIVDDEIEIRDGLSQYFPWHELEFEVVGKCENGKQAWDFIVTNQVDVILCDIRMPVMSGLELAQQIHAQKKKVTVVFLSGYRDFEYAKQALIYNVKNYILKPTKFDELFQVFTEIKMILDEASDKSMIDHSEQLSYNEKVIAAIKSYVQQNYRTASLEGASAVAHINPFYVSKFFKDHTGVNFSDYVVKIKMEKAAELLKDIQYKIYEISDMVGYSHAKNFSRTFKNFYGKSPSEYRNCKNEGKIT